MEWCAVADHPTLTTLRLPNTLYPGNSTFAAITAVASAHVVLVAYIISSMREDQAEQETRNLSESRKDR